MTDLTEISLDSDSDIYKVDPTTLLFNRILEMIDVLSTVLTLCSNFQSVYCNPAFEPENEREEIRQEFKTHVNLPEVNKTPETSEALL